MTLRGRLRQATRMAATAGWTGVCYLAWLPALLLRLGSDRFAYRWTTGVTRLWSRGLVHTLRVRIEVRGHPPDKPFFLVANHLSYLDIPVLASRLGNTFVSKHDLSVWPVLGHLARAGGTIFINRTLKRDALRVMEGIDRAIACGAGIVVFPEGTSSRGDRIYPLKTALLEWAARRAFPVHAATLHYVTDDPARPADQAVCWWGDMTFVPHLMQLLTLRRIQAVLTFAPRPVVERDRRRLADRLRVLLEDGLVPVTGSEVA